jgi:hypothetical protein
MPATVFAIEPRVEQKEKPPGNYAIKGAVEEVRILYGSTFNRNGWKEAGVTKFLRGSWVRCKGKAARLRGFRETHMPQIRIYENNWRQSA